MMPNLLDSLDPIFKDCVGESDHRYSLHKPWISRGFVYATDDRVIVRQSTAMKDTDHCSPPGAAGFFDEFQPTGEPIPLPDIGVEESSPVCPHCNAPFDGDGCVARIHEPVAIGPGLVVADYYLWILLRHGIRTVEPTTRDGCYSFRKGTVEGLLMGRDPDYVGDGDE